MKYPIRVVSQMTGITIDSLRAWEKRYQVVQPSRSNGHRLYSDAQVEKLKLLKRGLERGISIGRLSKMQITDLINFVEEEKTSTQEKQNESIDIIFNAVKRLDYISANQELERLAAFLKPRIFTYTIARPLMQLVGDAWARKEIGVAEEHMISGIMRNILGSFIRLFAVKNPNKRVLFSTPSNQLHEFGILSCAMLAIHHHIEILYLGPSLPAHEIVKAAIAAECNLITLGLSECDDELIKELASVMKEKPENIDIVYGGLHEPDPALERLGLKMIHTFEDYEGYLEKFVPVPSPSLA